MRMPRPMRFIATGAGFADRITASEDFHLALKQNPWALF